MLFYEYFITGRVSELAGANGAYNLFESEKRANIIIAKLDVIISILDEIKDNKYTLYCALKESNKLLESVKEQIEESENNITEHVKSIEVNTSNANELLKGIYKTENEIAISAKLTEKYSKISANSSRAIAYMKVLFG